MRQCRDTVVRSVWKRGRPRATPLPAPLGSSQSGPVLRSTKLRRTSGDGSCSTDMGSVVTAFLDTFDGSSNSAYSHWLEAVQSTAASHEYASFVTKKVVAQANGVWTTGTIQCLRQGLLQSMTCTFPADTILPNKSQPFSIVWGDNTDSICDLPSVLTFLDNHANNCHHRANANRSSPATNRSVRTTSNGAAAPSSLSSPSSLPQSPLPPHNPPASAPASAAGIFEGISSRSGDLVDNLTRSGSFSFLSELFGTERLFELRDFRIAKVTPKGEAIEQFTACMYLVLDLPDKYPHDSLTAHILDCVSQCLPAFLYTSTHRGRVRKIISSAKRFHRGDRKGLWETALRLARKEIDTNNKGKQNRATRDTSSIRPRVEYAEHCARKGALSKVNQTITSTSMPNADPTNIDLIRVKHPETAHPDRDPVRLSSRLWPRPQVLEEHWSSDVGIEFLDKWFSVAKICQYFRTCSPVTMPDITLFSFSVPLNYVRDRCFQQLSRCAMVPLWAP